MERLLVKFKTLSSEFAVKIQDLQLEITPSRSLLSNLSLFDKIKLTFTIVAKV